MKVLNDTAATFEREIRPVLREPVALTFAMLQPILFLVLFGPLLDTMPGVPGNSPWEWFVPGVVVMLALFGTSPSGANLLSEIHTGSYERTLVSPAHRGALLLGRTAKEGAILATQALVVLVGALLFVDVDFHPLGVVAGLLLLIFFGLGLGALSNLLALAVKGRDFVFIVVQQTLLFPLLLLSGMLLPMELGPRWLEVLSRFNPVTYIVDAERALFMGEFSDIAVLWGLLSATGITVAGLVLGVRAMQRAKI
ncbi:ABC transporter permease [Streptomyces sp. NPDC020875]|uniref:ABC transporter permease n=1 Tax=Streptomyces sp. NPDC020875 TaxID=3154898 RepID=UPI003409A2AB